MHFILQNYVFVDRINSRRTTNRKRVNEYQIDIGNVAQMVERSFRIRKARGSIPLISILEKRREREIEDRKEKRKKEEEDLFLFKISR